MCSRIAGLGRCHSRLSLGGPVLVTIQTVPRWVPPTCQCLLPGTWTQRTLGKSLSSGPWSHTVDLSTASLCLPQPVLGRKVFPRSSWTARLLLFSNISSQPLEAHSAPGCLFHGVSHPCPIAIDLSTANPKLLEAGTTIFSGHSAHFQIPSKMFSLLLFITHRMVVCGPPPQIKILVKKKNTKYCGTRISLY